VAVLEAVRMEAILVTAFVVECFGTVATLATGFVAKGCPVSPPAAVAVFLLAVLAAFAFVRVCKAGAHLFGAWFSKRLTGDPLADARTMRKFVDQSWQLVLHVAMTALELYILKVDGGGKPWLDDYTSFWLPANDIFDVYSRAEGTAVHVLYLTQAAAWFATCTVHIRFEERRRDYVMMLAHHVVTIALVWLSYTFNFVRLGVAIMYVHDATDIFIDLLKLTNYLQLEGPRRLFLVELTYVTNLATWAYWRLYVLPVHIVWHGIVIAPREIGTAPDRAYMAAFTKAAGSAYTRGHAPGYVFGDGSFDLAANVRAMPMIETIPHAGYLWWGFSALMAALITMHVVWYLLILNIGRRMLFGMAPSETGEAEYEGEQYKEPHARQAATTTRAPALPLPSPPRQPLTPPEFGGRTGWLAAFTALTAVLLSGLCYSVLFQALSAVLPVTANPAPPLRLPPISSIVPKLAFWRAPPASPYFEIDKAPYVRTPHCSYYNLTTVWDAPLAAHLHPPPYPPECDPFWAVTTCVNDGSAFDATIWCNWAATNWQIPLVACAIYLSGVVGVERIMRHRPKLTLRVPIMGWNFLLSVFSVGGAVSCIPALLYGQENGLLSRGFYASVCAHPSSYGCGRVGVFVLLFILSKLVELVDTLWLRLRKVPVIPLHWYHHATVLLYCWHSYSARIGTGLWYASMNYFVHSIMYFYFGVTQLGPGGRKLAKRFSMLITLLQLSQMVMGIVITVAAVVYHSRGETCYVSLANSALGLGMYTSYFVLFAVLFKQNYFEKPREKKA